MNRAVIINPGSRISDTPVSSWNNTLQQAKKNCKRWFLEPMEKEGFIDIKCFLKSDVPDRGRWTFIFEHLVTGISVELEIHGVDDLKEYKKDNIFTPRIYWNGSSCADPDIKDFYKDGYVPVITYKKVQNDQ
jgi:hypothetical protein